jgi:hypothetical protein
MLPNIQWGGKLQSPAFLHIIKINFATPFVLQVGIC